MDIKAYLTWPWLVSVPLLMAGFGFSVFFIGTDSVLLAPFILCLLAYALIAVAPNISKGWAIPRSRTVIFVGLFWLWMLVSLIWTPIPYVSTIFTIILSILPAFFLINIIAQDAEKWTRVHVLALWLVLLAFAVWALIQYFVLYETYGKGRIHHPMLNPNNLAGLFNLGLFPAIGLFFLARRRRDKIICGIIAAVFYTALIVTQSRGAFLACIISFLILIPLASLKIRDNFPWKKIVFLAVMAILLPYLANIYRGGILEENLVGGETFKNVRSAEHRLYLWKSTWEMIKDHPWLGTGLSSFYFFYPRYRHPADGSDGFFAHMDPLQFWAEMGIMAPLFFYGVLICVLLRTIKAVRAAGDDQKIRLEIIAPFCGMLALTGHTHITFHLYMPGMLLPLAGLMSYWYLATERALGDAKDRIIWQAVAKKRMAMAAALAVILIIVGGWVLRTTAATYLMGQVKQNVAANKTDEALGKLTLAGKVAPDSYGRYYEYEARFRVNHLWNNAKKMNKEAVRKMYQEALHYLAEAEKRNPAYTTIWDLQARTHYAVNGVLINDGDELAKELLHKVIENNPMAVDSRLGLANIYLAENNLGQAVEVLETGMKWPRPKGQRDLTFLVTLAKLKQRQGEHQAAAYLMQEAQRRARSYGMKM